MKKKFMNNMYDLIKSWYKNLKYIIESEPDNFELQFVLRENLNETIRLYKYYEGNKSIKKYLKYYV